jgi:hypothetical protein
MQFICDSGHKFHYPAKFILTQTTDSIPESDPGIRMEAKGASNQRETYHCPFCESQRFTEYVEPVVVADVLEDMQLVEFAMVPAFILKGYVELDRKDHVFAKGVIMLKTKPTVPENAAPIVMRQEKDYISEALETAAAVVEKAKQP